MPACALPGFDPEGVEPLFGPEAAPIEQVSTNGPLPLVTDEQPGMMPDLSGMSAREAVRKLVKLGLVARVSGDGLVVAQDPAAGTAIATGGVCRLVLDRSPARHSASTSQP